MRFFAERPKIGSNWQTDTRRHPLWWTTAVYVNGYSRGSSDLSRRFRARTEARAREKAYAWLEGGR